LNGYGKFLRSTSLDELPELINIFKGDMSIVGPRPLLVKYLPRYSEEQRRRHIVRPGLTGLAQVSGRNAISWEDRFKLDVKYVNKVTFVGDVKIIWQTVMSVLKREGISSETSATMEEFMGIEKEPTIEKEVRTSSHE
jgi:lipopolysaccharide/colanic/teichoic acid biosynthesis glycosyltransferase